MSSQTECSPARSGPDPPKEFQLPASPCPELLVTNSVPSDFQSDEIRKLILDVEAEISGLDAEIINVSRALGRRLKLKRAGLAKFVKSHRGVVSAIRRLPSELLAEFFSYFLAASDSFHSPELALSRVVGVCNRWRTTVLASPMLWRHISLSIYESPSHGPEKLKQISMQLQRSAAAALSIGLDAETEHIYPFHELPFSIRLLDLLLTESRRWKSLYLFIHPSDHKHFTKAEFPILEKLSLVVFESWTENASLFFKSFPALVDLTIRVDGNSLRVPGKLILEREFI
ncbi:hypothetical protein GGX14DRAFT_597029 [Mycena pura]|uniref:F-box domain-containing protein n=1 Tax=Mycena pura TaxID=153505 RepID=A0AAD6UPK3_9AGAR|nr:hypothetical protein GGX14DRAFT_597029 [Mycena pura]